MRFAIVQLIFLLFILSHFPLQIRQAFLDPFNIRGAGIAGFGRIDRAPHVVQGLLHLVVRLVRLGVVGRGNLGFVGYQTVQDFVLVHFCCGVFRAVEALEPKRRRLKQKKHRISKVIILVIGTLT